MGDGNGGKWDGSSFVIRDTNIEIKKPDKVLAPDGTTRRDVVDYYAEVSDTILPYLQGKRLTGVRWPDGVNGRSFYLKSVPKTAPEWVQTVPAPHGEADGRYVVVQDARTLIWLASTDVLEYHVPNTVHDQPEVAEGMVLDLDPGSGCGIQECAVVALMIAEKYLGGRGLRYKTSGSKGLHLYLPYEKARSIEETLAEAENVATEMAATWPSRVSSKRGASERSGKVFVDWHQNSRHRTTAVAYTLRGRDPIGVSVPVSKKEVELAAEGEVDLVFTCADVISRLRQFGDLYKTAQEPE